MSTIKLVVFGRLSTNEIINSEGSEVTKIYIFLFKFLKNNCNL